MQGSQSSIAVFVLNLLTENRHTKHNSNFWIECVQSVECKVETVMSVMTGNPVPTSERVEAERSVIKDVHQSNHY